MSDGKKKKCRHDPVKFITEKYGDVHVCMKCHVVSKEDVFTKEELEVLVEFAKYNREKMKG